MQTRTLYSIMFFKDVICDLTEYCQAWFPLVDLHSCEVIDDFHCRHITSYIYATKSLFVNYNLWYKEIKSDLINTFIIKFVSPNDEERVITSNIFLQRMMRYS